MQSSMSDTPESSNILLIWFKNQMPENYAQSVDSCIKNSGDKVRFHLLTSRNTLEEEERNDSIIWQMIKKGSLDCAVLEDEISEQKANPNRESIPNVKYGIHEKFVVLLKNEPLFQLLEDLALKFALTSNPSVAGDIYKLLVPFYADQILNISSGILYLDCDLFTANQRDNFTSEFLTKLISEFKALEQEKIFLNPTSNLKPNMNNHL